MEHVYINCIKKCRFSHDILHFFYLGTIGNGRLGNRLTVAWLDFGSGCFLVPTFLRGLLVCRVSTIIGQFLQVLATLCNCLY